MNSRNPRHGKNTHNIPEDPPEFDHLFKIIMVGDPGVGKSSVLLRFADEIYNENYYATIGVDFRFKTLLMNNKSIKLQIWDTAGQEKFRSLTNAYYKGVDAILLAFDLTNRHSFNNIEEWIDQIQDCTTTHPVIVLIGAKADMYSGHSVTRQEIEELANEKGYPYYLVSAKTNENIMESFLHVVTELIERRTKPEKDTKILDLSNEERNPWTQNCCPGGS